MDLGYELAAEVAHYSNVLDPAGTAALRQGLLLDVVSFQSSVLMN